MTDYLDKLKEDLSEYEIKSGLSKSPSALEVLWEHYMNYNPVDDGLIRSRNDALEPIFRELNFPTSDLLTELIVDLVTAYQRAAFFEGIHIGVQLSDALHEKIPQPQQ